MSKACRGLWLLLVVATITSAWSRPASSAEHWTPDQNKCNEQQNTQAIADCILGRTKFWDGRLNQAYKALTAMFQDPAMKARLVPLQAAQREWVKYRDANCIGYYGSQDGTIRQIEVAGCLLEMTQTRAIELQGEGPQ